MHIALVSLLFACHPTRGLLVVSDTADTGSPDRDGDGSPADVDCNDDDAAVHPGAVEVCNGVDDDCNGLIDDADPGVTGQTVWYRDLDGDGYGDPTHASQLACDDPSDADAAWVTDDTDCDDFDPLVNPTLEWYADVDGDGYGDATSAVASCTQPAGDVADDTDCDDSSPDAWPGEPDYHDVDRGDGSFDYDCDGAETPEYPDLSACAYTSSDGGGWAASSGWVDTSTVPTCGTTAEYFEDRGPYGSESYCEYASAYYAESRTQLCK